MYNNLTTQTEHVESKNPMSQNNCYYSVIEQLPLRTVVFFVAYVLSRGAQLYSSKNNTNKLSPYKGFNAIIYKELIYTEVLVPTDENIKSLAINKELHKISDEQLFITEYSIFPRINDTDIEDLLQYTQKLFLQQENWPPHWRKELEAIWQELIYYEHYEYLCLSMMNSLFSINNIGKVTDQALNILVDNFTISQSQSIILSAINSVKNFYNKEDISLQHASSTVITTLLRQAKYFKTHRPPRAYNNLQIETSILHQLIYSIIPIKTEKDANMTIADMRKYNILPNQYYTFQLSRPELDLLISAYWLYVKLHPNNDSAETIELLSKLSRNIFKILSINKRAEVFLVCIENTQELDTLVKSNSFADKITEMLDLDISDSETDMIEIIENQCPIEILNRLEMISRYVPAGDA